MVFGCGMLEVGLCITKIWWSYIMLLGGLNQWGAFHRAIHSIRFRPPMHQRWHTWARLRRLQSRLAHIVHQEPVEHQHLCISSVKMKAELPMSSVMAHH